MSERVGIEKAKSERLAQLDTDRNGIYVGKAIGEASITIERAVDGECVE